MTSGTIQRSKNADAIKITDVKSNLNAPQMYELIVNWTVPGNDEFMASGSNI